MKKTMLVFPSDTTPQTIQELQYRFGRNFRVTKISASLAGMRADRIVVMPPSFLEDESEVLSEQRKISLQWLMGCLNQNASWLEL